MRTVVVLIFVMVAFALATALLLEPRWVLRKLLSPVRTFVLRSHRMLGRVRHRSGAHHEHDHAK